MKILTRVRAQSLLKYQLFAISLGDTYTHTPDMAGRHLDECRMYLVLVKAFSSSAWTVTTDCSSWSWRLLVSLEGQLHTDCLSVATL